jgi:predicted Zn-dependent peptidase
MLNDSLDNGLGVSVLKRQGLESVGICVSVAYGELSEPQKLMGMAHFLEHMLFKGTKKRTSEELKKELIGMGNMWNGKTYLDYTLFEIYCHKNYLETSLDIVADIMSNSTFAKEEFERERGIIFSEISKFVHYPYVVVSNSLEAALFDNERFNYLAQGTDETVRRIQRDDLYTVYAGNYGPKCSHLGIYGALDERKALGLIESKFSDYSSKSKKIKTELKPRNKAKSIEIKQKGIDEAMVGLAFRTNGYDRYKEDMNGKLSIDIVATILSNRLRSELREKRGISYGMNAFHRTFLSLGYLRCDAGVKKKDVEQAKAIMLKECEKLENGEINKDELSYTRNELLIRNSLNFENSISMAELLSYYGLIGVPKFIETFESILKKISIDDVRNAAAKYINISKCGTVSLLPF